MKKTLIALAVLGVSAGVAHAQSSVTIYGQLNPSYDYVKVKPAAGGDYNITNMADNSSRLGFKGTEDLGGGLKAIFQLESYYNVTDEGSFAGGDGARDSWVGLAGSWGSLTFGSQDNAVKKMFAGYDPFADSIGDYNNIFSNGIDSRNSKSAYYTSPKFGGFSFQGNYALDTARVSNDNATKQAKWAVGADYTNGPLQVTAAFDKVQNDNGGDGDWKGYRVGAAYTLPSKTKLSAMFAREDGSHVKLPKWSTTHNTFFFGVVQPINNIDLIANYIQANDADGKGDSGAKNFNLGARYNFSKRTNVTAQYTYLKNDDNGKYGLDTGYAHTVTTGTGDDAVTTTPGGTKFNAFSVRLQHNF